MKVPKIHLSRKLMLVLGGVLVTLGGTGAAAVYIGADTLLGPSYAELNGLECTEVTSVEIHKKDRFWVRTFVTTDKPGDGLTRVKTALRVAKAVQETKKADLVQVVVLDVNGPKDRSGMRGRAVGADVVYVPDPAHVPEDVSARMFTARYVDGLAAPNGDFFGERVDMLEVDIEALVAKLNDQTDCVKSETALPEGDGHGAPAAGHGEKAADGHGESGGHGEAPADGHGEAPADAHGETPAGEHGEETPVAEHGAEESKGWMASLMGMVGLGGDEAPAEGHPAPADGHGAVAQGHEAPAEDHAEPASVAHGEAGTEAETDHVAASTDTHAEQPAADTGHADEQMAHGAAEDTAPHDEAAGHDVAVDKAADHIAPTEETSETDGGWFDSIKGMVGLGGSEGEVPTEDAAAKTEPSQDADAASTDHGAAWLEQMRAQPISSGGAVQPAATPEEHGAANDGHAPDGEHAAESGNTHTQDGHSVPAEDEAVLPPKAKAKGAEHAKAGH